MLIFLTFYDLKKIFKFIKMLNNNYNKINKEGY